MMLFDQRLFPYREQVGIDQLADAITWVFGNVQADPKVMLGVKALLFCNDSCVPVFDRPTSGVTGMVKMVQDDIRGGWVTYSEPIFAFIDPNDAMMFRLRFA